MSRSDDAAKVVRSHAELHRLLPRLFAQQEQRPQLAIAALANPVLALRELGYVLAPEIARHMERLARFGAARTAEIDAIEAELQRELGEKATLDDRQALAKAVMDRLPDSLLDAAFPDDADAKGGAAKGPDAPPLQAAGKSTAPRAVSVRERLADLLPEPRQRRFDGPASQPDPLAALKGRAPVLDAMLRLREIEGSRARLAEPEVFRGILDGRIATPVTRVRFRPARQPPAEG